jgi:hypothetical protein
MCALCKYRTLKGERPGRPGMDADRFPIQLQVIIQRLWRLAWPPVALQHPYTPAWNRSSRIRYTSGAEWAVKEQLAMLGKNRSPMAN